MGISLLGVFGHWLWSYLQLCHQRRTRRDICLQELYRRRFDVYTKLANLACQIGTMAAIGSGLFERRVGNEAISAIKTMGVFELSSKARADILKRLYEELNSAILIVEDSVARKLYPLLEAISYLLGLEDGLEGDASMLSFTSEHRKAANDEIVRNVEALLHELAARLHIEQVALDLERLIKCSFEVAQRKADGEAEFVE